MGDQQQRPGYSRRAASSRSMEGRSRWLVGSSSTSAQACCPSPRAISSLRASPATAAPRRAAAPGPRPAPRPVTARGPLRRAAARAPPPAPPRPPPRVRSCGRYSTRSSGTRACAEQGPQQRRLARRRWGPRCGCGPRGPPTSCSAPSSSTSPARSGHIEREQPRVGRTHVVDEDRASERLVHLETRRRLGGPLRLAAQYGHLRPSPASAQPADVLAPMVRASLSFLSFIRRPVLRAAEAACCSRRVCRAAAASRRCSSCACCRASAALELGLPAPARGGVGARPQPRRPAWTRSVHVVRASSSVAIVRHDARPRPGSGAARQRASRAPRRPGGWWARRAAARPARPRAPRPSASACARPGTAWASACSARGVQPELPVQPPRERVARLRDAVMAGVSASTSWGQRHSTSAERG